MGAGTRGFQLSMLATAARPTCHATLAEGWCVTAVQVWAELLQPLAHVSCGPCSHREGEAEGGKLGFTAGQSGLRGGGVGRGRGKNEMGRVKRGGGG